MYTKMALSQPNLNHIGQGIQLLPERMRGAEPAPDLAIEIIADDSA